VSVWSSVLGLLIAGLGAWGIPALGMRMLVPSLESSGRLTPNYRGRMVFVGLGLVWIFWSFGTLLLLAAVFLSANAAYDSLLLLSAAWPLVLGTFALGFIDDVFGTSADKGLKGHMRALAHGRLTTGGLKLIGIGVISLYASYSSVLLTTGVVDSPPVMLLIVLCRAVLIAGCANLINLLDLRPGRALKSYLLLSTLAVIGLILTEVVQDGSLMIEPAALPRLLLPAVLLAGPALAVWRYDLAERGMLGDAGANAAGALVGLVLAVALPLWWLLAAAVAAVVLNVASERVSFSQFIAQNRLLAWLDGLGRLPDDPALLGASTPDVSVRNGRHDG